MASSEEGSDQTLKRHDLGQQPCVVSEASPGQNFLQPQPLPDLVADMDCSGLSGLFDFDLL